MAVIPAFRKLRLHDELYLKKKIREKNKTTALKIKKVQFLFILILHIIVFKLLLWERGKMGNIPH